MSTISFPKTLKYQFNNPAFTLNISDRCCMELKEKPIKEWQMKNHKKHVILGIRRDEGGRRRSAKCITEYGKGIHFNPLSVVSDEFMDWLVERLGIKLCELYYPPYNFKRTGCKGCPFNINLQKELDVLEKFFPNERRQCEVIWKPVYEEYRRIGYRLSPYSQISLELEYEDI